MGTGIVVNNKYVFIRIYFVGSARKFFTNAKRVYAYNKSYDFLNIN